MKPQSSKPGLSRAHYFFSSFLAAVLAIFVLYIGVHAHQTDLVVVQNKTMDVVAAGQKLHYELTIQVDSLAPSSAKNVRLLGYLTYPSAVGDLGLSGIEVVSDHGSCLVSKKASGQYECYFGDLARGEEIRLTVSAPVPSIQDTSLENIQNRVQIISESKDANQINNFSVEQVKVVEQDLTFLE